MIDPKKLEVYILEYNDFDKLVRKTYNQYYDFVVDMECGNDSEHLFRDIGNESLYVGNKILSKWEIQDMNTFIKTGRYCHMAGTLLEDMAMKKVIPPGNYLIEVSW